MRNRIPSWYEFCPCNSFRNLPWAPVFLVAKCREHSCPLSGFLPDNSHIEYLFWRRMSRSKHKTGGFIKKRRVGTNSI
ncbi:hypothetical protein D7X94_12770 [Acutalibacter sp. 1XD8-33]|nr:hypothetical protein D7X94_12770 [Acutalibacter sp. 1XD8-33]